MNKKRTGNILLQSQKPIQPTHRFNQPTNLQHFEETRAGNTKARHARWNSSPETPLRAPSTEKPASREPASLRNARGLSSLQSPQTSASERARHTPGMPGRVAGRAPGADSPSPDSSPRVCRPREGSQACCPPEA